MFKSLNKEILACFTSLVKIADSQAKSHAATLDELRDALARERAEATALRRINISLEVQVDRAHSNFDWLKAKVNQLEYEKAALLQQSNINLPVPEIMNKPPKALEDPTGSFEDIGDLLSDAVHGDNFGDAGDSRYAPLNN